MKPTTLILGIAVLAATLGLGGRASANSNELLSGRFVGSGTSQEWLTPQGGSPEKVDLAASSILYLDGKGHVFSNLTVTLGGTFSSFPTVACTYTETGNYTLNDDGTGSMTLDSTVTSGGCEPTHETYNIFATQGGSKICYSQTSITTTAGTSTIVSLIGSGCSTKQ